MAIARRVRAGRQQRTATSLVLQGRTVSYGWRVRSDDEQSFRPEPAFAPTAINAAAARREAVVLAGHLGDRDTVTAGLLAADGLTRAAALGALVRLDALTERDLIAGLADTDGAVVRRAIEISAHQLDRTASIDHRLVQLVTGTDADTAEVAVWALGERWEERGAESPGDALLTMVLDAVEAATGKHDDALVREAAVAALGAIGAQRSLPVIIEAASDKATVRRRAVIALAPFDGPAVDAALATARNDRDWQVRQAAEDLSDPDDGDTDGSVTVIGT